MSQVNHTVSHTGRENVSYEFDNENHVSVISKVISTLIIIVLVLIVGFALAHM